MKREILVVDDERSILQSMVRVLDGAGYGVRTAGSGEAALAAVSERRPDLVLLDVMMPGKDGLETCRELRATVPGLLIVFLTALDTPEDELRGLSSGGDSYIAKSVPDEVLLARISALLRLQDGDEGSSGGDFDFGSWRIEAERLRMVRPNGRAEELGEREVAFLRMLATRPGAFYDRDTIITRLWGVESDILDNRLSNFVCLLRKKLGREGNAIVNTRGSGYAYRPRSAH